MPTSPEAFAIVGENGPRERLTACGADVRGLVYAVLEIADRVEHGPHTREALRLERPLVERPANAVRTVARLLQPQNDGTRTTDPDASRSEVR